MKLEEDNQEEITVLVKYTNGGKEEEATVPLDLNLGDFRREAQMVFGIPTRYDFVLMLEKPNQVLEVLSDEKTFRSATIQNNAVLILLPEMGRSY